MPRVSPAVSFFPFVAPGLIRLAFCALLAFAGGCALSVPSAFAQPPTLSEMTVDNRSGVVTVRFGLRLEGLEELTARLTEGEVIAVVAKAALAQRRDWAWDSALSSKEMRAVIRYDALGKEFALKRPGLQAEARDAVLASLLARSLSELSLELGPSTALVRNQRYLLELQVSVERADAPRWLKRALFFWSWNVFPTAQYALEFAY